MIQRKSRGVQKYSFYAIKLRMNEWRFDIAPEDYVQVVVSALNYCVTHYRMRISGYLVTTRSVFILFGLKGKRPGDAIREFEHVFGRKLISRYPLLLRSGDHDNNWFSHERLYDRRVLPILVACDKYDRSDHRLLRLHRTLKTYKYSSVIDYEGGVGPVLVKRLPPRSRCYVQDGWFVHT